MDDEPFTNGMDWEVNDDLVVTSTNFDYMANDVTFISGLPGGTGAPGSQPFPDTQTIYCCAPCSYIHHASSGADEYDFPKSEANMMFD